MKREHVGTYMCIYSLEHGHLAHFPPINQKDQLPNLDTFTSVVEPKLFFSDPDPTFQFSDNFGSGSGSDYGSDLISHERKKC